MVPRADLYNPKRGVDLGEDWKPRLPDMQLREGQHSDIGTRLQRFLLMIKKWLSFDF